MNKDITQIEIIWGSGDATTRLSAFDKALFDANINNYNLIRLSSIIPSEVEIKKMGTFDRNSTTIGKTLYVVMASIISTERGSTISAGLGWVLSDEGGLFIEPRGVYPKDECREELETGLQEMMEYREWNWRGEIEDKILSHEIENVGCTLVCAVYGTTPP